MATLKRRNTEGQWDFLQLTGADVSNIITDVQDTKTQLAQKTNQINQLTINVKDFGALGQGTDDTTAILAAINFLKSQSVSPRPGGKLFFPDGSYGITQPLDLPKYCYMYGNGYSSQIKWIGNDTTSYMVRISADPNNTSDYCTISDLLLNGDYKANGVYDGYNRTGWVGTRLLMKDCKILACKIGITMDSMGSEFKNIYTFGEYSLDNTGRCTIGFNILLTDNRITDCRVQCFKNYGVYCVGSSNHLSGVKSAVNGNGFYFKGNNFNCTVEAQENFLTNFIFDDVSSSSFNINSSGAGCVNRAEGESVIPETLNAYTLVDFRGKCFAVDINGVLLARAGYSNRWSCEGGMLKVGDSCKGITANFTASNSYFSKANPYVVDCFDTVSNKITVNGVTYSSGIETINPTPTVTNSSKTTLSQNGNSVDVSIVDTVLSTDYVAVFSFLLSSLLTDGFVVSATLNKPYTEVSFYMQYKVDGVNYSFGLSSTNFRWGSYSKGVCTVRSIAQAKAGNTQYQSFVSQGKTITEEKVFLQVVGASTGNANLQPNATLEMYNI